MSDYLRSEIANIKGVTEQFAKHYPQQARALKLDSNREQDPAVQQLLFGIASLTARIREQLDQGVPELSENLLRQIAPQLVQAYPSATVLQFAAKAGIKHSLFVAKGSSASSEKVGPEQTACQFRTTTASIVQPIIVSEAKIHTNQNHSMLTISLQTESGAFFNTLTLDNLKFFVASEFNQSLQFLTAMFTQLAKVDVSFPEYPQWQSKVLGTRDIVKPCHVAIEDTMLPLTANSQLGYQLLQDYLLFPEKHSFFTVNELNKIYWPEQCQAMTLNFYFDEILPHFNLKTSDIKLNCVPAVNLFEHSCEPVHMDHSQTNYPLVLDNEFKNSMQLFSIDEVQAINQTSGKRKLYQPFSEVDSESPQAFYELQQQAQQLTLKLDYSHLRGYPTEEVLSCRVTACNGDYPEQYLLRNSFQLTDAQLNRCLGVVNVVPPTKYHPAPKSEQYRNFWLQHMTANIKGITNLETIRTLLKLSDRSGQVFQTDSIQEIVVQPMQQVASGIVQNGNEIILTVNEQCFTDSAEIYPLGCVLHQFFSIHASLNSFVQTRIISQPSNKEYLWAPQHRFRDGLNS